MNWLMKRIVERTSLDGIVLMGCGIAMLIAPLNLIAYGMIAYGAWTFWKEETE